MGSTLQLHIHGKTKAGSPSEGALQPCVSQSKALLKRGVISETLPDAAALQPEAQFPVVQESVWSLLFHSGDSSGSSF